MTHRFHFTLEPIRMLRKHAESEAMSELASELGQAHVLEDEHVRTRRRLEEARCTALAGTSAAELAARQLYLERMERELSELKKRAERHEARVDEVRERLTDAVRARETLDRVAVRRGRAHALANRRSERVLGDELSLEFTRRPGDAAP